MLSEETITALGASYQRILQTLTARGIPVDPYPTFAESGAPEGVAAARAYPIQGVLKYHGMADWHLRTAYFPSISLNNDAAYTCTIVRFSRTLPKDTVIVNGQSAIGRVRERVIHVLDAIRKVARIETHALVLSRNIVRAKQTGKGLGTSASASAALAMAAIAATLGPTAAENRRFVSCMARLLAGSGCRSAVGGLALWLSHPRATHEDSFAVRLDQHDELADLALLTVPMDSRIGLETEMAHREAPHSLFFEPWLLSREKETLECLEATQQRDWRTLGQLAELDSIRLHAITMTASRENKLFAWEPENILLFRLCNDLRTKGIPVYFSTDTGPTTVLLTHRQYSDTVRQAIQDLGLGLEIIQGKVAGPAELIPLEEAERAIGAIPPHSLLP